MRQLENLRLNDEKKEKIYNFNTITKNNNYIYIDLKQISI